MMGGMSGLDSVDVDDDVDDYDVDVDDYDATTVVAVRKRGPKRR